MKKVLFAVLAVFSCASVAQGYETKTTEIRRISPTTDYTIRREMATDVDVKDDIETQATDIAKALNVAFGEPYVAMYNDYYKKLMPQAMKFERIRATFDRIAARGLGATSPDFSRLCIVIPSIMVDGYKSVVEKRASVSENDFKVWKDREAKTDTVAIMLNTSHVGDIIDQVMGADAGKEFDRLIDKYQASSDVFQEYTVIVAAVYDLGRWKAMNNR